jgi:1-acyl-sn-glycerol-3-phosphate acyltransferase
MTRDDSDEPDDLPDPLERNLLWRTLQVILQNVLCFWLGYRARGMGNIPPSGGGLMVVNHQSFLDPVLVGLPLTRPISFLARDNLFRVPVLGWVLNNMYAMPINREAASTASIREAIRRLKFGFLVGIFPEGTRTTDGTVGELKPGFLALMRRSKQPVYPIGISGAFEAMPRGSFMLWPRRVRVVYGEPISAETIASYGRDEEGLLTVVRLRLIACHRAAEDWRLGRETAET